MEMTRSDLERIYKENTVAEAMAILGIRSPVALYGLLEKAGIGKKRPDVRPHQKTNIKIVG